MAADNKFVGKVIAGTAVAIIVGVAGVVYGHIQKPAHPVAAEKLSNLETTTTKMDEKLDAGLLALERQTVLLKSIDKRIDDLE